MKRSSLAILSSLSLLCSSAPVVGQNIYRWTDAQGHTHFSNAPVNVAKSVDEELPPATSFGGEPGSIPFPLRVPRPAKRQSGLPLTPATAPPAEPIGDETTAVGGEENTAVTENAPATSSAANTTAPLLQTVADPDEEDDADEKPNKNLQKEEKRSVPSDEDPDDEDNGSLNGDDDSDGSEDDADETEA